MGPLQELPVPIPETAIIQELRNRFPEQHVSILKSSKEVSLSPGSPQMSKMPGSSNPGLWKRLEPVP